MATNHPRYTLQMTPHGWHIVAVHRPSMLYGETTQAVYVGRDACDAWAYYRACDAWASYLRRINQR